MNDDLIMVVAGEASADAHAASLVRELRVLRPGLAVYGVGGKSLQAAGAELLFDFSRTGVVGITEVLPQLGRFWRAYQTLARSVEERRPRGVVLLDLPDFNLILAKKIKQRSPETKIIYYISPQVWGWRPGRVKKIAARADAMLVLFPFEEEIYRRVGMDVEFVGHPLRDEAKPSAGPDELRREYGLEGAPGPVIAVLPGSRRSEIERYLPVMAETAVRLTARWPELRFLLAKAPTLSQDLIERNLCAAAGIIKVIDGRACDVLSVSDLAMAGSGTVTLEAAVMGVPMVVLGAVSWLTYHLVKPFALVSRYSLPNVIAGREIVTELIQNEANADRLTEKMAELVADPEKAATIRKELDNVRQALGPGGASLRAAQAVHRRLWGEKRVRRV